MSRERVWVRRDTAKGIGIIVGSTRIGDEVKEIRVYFERENEIVSFKPEELVIVHEEDN